MDNPSEALFNSSSELASLLSEKAVKDFMAANIFADPYKLLLRDSPFAAISMGDIVSQIVGRRIAQKKFAFLTAYQKIIYPVKLSLEQASSEMTAKYKSKIMSGSALVDLTGGMGVDCYILGQNFHCVDYVEPDGVLFEVTQHNYRVLDFDHCTLHNMDCEQYLNSTSRHYDWIYIDPSRRTDGDRKISITNYDPNIVDLQDQIRAAATNTLVKLSPMQDLKECIKALKTVSDIWIISIKNDVKELLIKLSQHENYDPTVTAVDLVEGVETSYVSNYGRANGSMTSGSIEKYLYQPASALIKSGLSDSYAIEHQLVKVHQNTSFYTSDRLMEDYFGRVFIVKAQVSVSRKEAAKHLKDNKANIITKNFPLSPSQLAKKLKLSDGGEQYVIGITDALEGKVILICDRLT